MQLLQKKDMIIENHDIIQTTLATDSIVFGKYQKTLSEINKLEVNCQQWLSSRNLQLQYKSTFVRQGETKNIDSQTHQEQAKLRLVELKNEINIYFSNLKQIFSSEESIKLFTDTQLTNLFDEQNKQLEHKIKLYEDIEKLELFRGYPDSPKRTYSLTTNIILKKWLINNYSNPYPNKSSVQKLLCQTRLSKQQILNWFINARNSLKKTKQKESKFVQLVFRKYKEIVKTKEVKKKIRCTSINSVPLQTYQTNQIFQ